MRGKRGLDALEAMKLIWQMMAFAMCLVLIIYIFATVISVSYDPLGLKADTSAAMMVFSDAFSSRNDTSVISLDRFTPESIERVYTTIEQEEDPEDVLVEVLVFAPISARFMLTSLDDSFDTREFYYEEKTFLRLRELFVGRERTSLAFSRAENVVRVVDESNPGVLMPGRLTIEVIVR